MVSGGAGGACGGAVDVSKLARNALEALGGASAVRVEASWAEAFRVGSTGAEGAGSACLTIRFAGRELEARGGGVRGGGSAGWAGVAGGSGCAFGEISLGACSARCGVELIPARNTGQAVGKSCAILVVSVRTLDARAVARLGLKHTSCTFDASSDVGDLVEEGERSSEADGAYLRSLVAVLTM